MATIRDQILRNAQAYLNHLSLGHQQWTEHYMERIIELGNFRNEDAALLFIKIEKAAGNLK